MAKVFAPVHGGSARPGQAALVLQQHLQRTPYHCERECAGDVRGCAQSATTVELEGRIAIDKLFKSNADEFTDEMTSVEVTERSVNLDTAEVSTSSIVVPSGRLFATASADGTPNVTYVSVVRYVDRRGRPKVVRYFVMRAEQGAFVVPPQRAVWIPPGARHAVTIVEAAQLLTLYIDASAVPAHWTQSRVMVVSPLLRELVHALDRPQPPTPDAERALLTLLLHEMELADTQPLGVPMPSASGGDRRLRNLCEAVMQSPAQHATLAAWAAHAGASERTLARLFRDELGTSFARWRQQVVLAHAMPMLARGVSVGRVAQASGYASESAFSAMFKSAMGLPPTRLLARSQARPQAATASSMRA